LRLNAGPVRAYVAALLTALSLASPAAAGITHTGPPVPAVDIAKTGIENFGRVNANYYRGARPRGHEYAELAALGVKTLIDLTGPDADASEPVTAERAGLRYVRIPMTTHEPPTPAQLAKFLQIVNDPENQPVYVHCVGGRHRTGVMTAAYRMTCDGWTAQRAFSEMKRYKFGADALHPQFKAFVFAYHPQSPGTEAAPPVLASATPEN
jgi:tyrosine-protein phosphatase SIW14